MKHRLKYFYSIVLVFLFLSGCSKKFDKEYLRIKKDLLNQSSYQDKTADFKIGIEYVTTDNVTFYYVISLEEPVEVIKNIIFLAVVEEEKEKKTNTLFPSLGIVTEKIHLSSVADTENHYYRKILVNFIYEKLSKNFLIYLNYQLEEQSITKYLKISVHAKV